MSKIKTDDGTEILFKDWGTGQPIVFHLGWPLSADEWDNQLLFFLEKRPSRRCPRSSRPRSIESVVSE
jgi:pimeloyl-ACP methyl ester carboxylesterase